MYRILSLFLSNDFEKGHSIDFNHCLCRFRGKTQRGICSFGLLLVDCSDLLYDKYVALIHPT